MSIGTVDITEMYQLLATFKSIAVAFGYRWFGVNQDQGVVVGRFHRTGLVEKPASTLKAATLDLQQVQPGFLR